MYAAHIFLKIIFDCPPNSTVSNPDSGDTGTRSGKVKLGDFTDKETANLAKAGHRVMRQYVAVTEAFPLPINKEDLSWKCIVKAAQGNKEMLAKLDTLEANCPVKSQLIDYVGPKTVNNYLYLNTI